jgi:hypothetical protein
MAGVAMWSIAIPPDVSDHIVMCFFMRLSRHSVIFVVLLIWLWRFIKIPLVQLLVSVACYTIGLRARIGWPLFLLILADYSNQSLPFLFYIFSTWTTLRYLPHTHAQVIKSRLQSAPTGTYSGFMDCVRKTVAADGVGALWKGFGPAMARVSNYPYWILFASLLEWHLTLDIGAMSPKVKGFRARIPISRMVPAILVLILILLHEMPIADYWLVLSCI